jgi:integrase
MDSRVPAGLHGQIDKPRLYQLEQLPRTLPLGDGPRLLRSIDRTSSKGLRDYAMFRLIATYGLRTSEVVAIPLDDIRWRRGSLRIHQPKTLSPLELPLTNEVSSAIVKHLLANSSTPAVSQNLPENARPHRRAETHSRRGSLSIPGSEKRSPHSLPRSHETLAGGSPFKERNPTKDHRRHPRALFRSEHVDVPTIGDHGFTRSGTFGSGGNRQAKEGQR